MTDRKLLVLPVVQGSVVFATEHGVSVQQDELRVDIRRDQIVGRQPEKHEYVVVLDLQDLVDALRAGDDELADFEINGTVVGKSKKAVSVRLDDGRFVSLPIRFVNAELDDYVRSARLPRWLALDRGL